MFHAYITHSQAKAYLEYLEANGLVTYDRLEKSYHTTPKGLEYLAVAERMTELFPVSTKRVTLKERLIAPFAWGLP